MAKVGRPLKWKTAEELQEKIDEYFNSCYEDVSITEDKVIKKLIKPFTITGLALALDTNRETLMNYQEKEEFFDTIKKAKLRIENFAEEQLFLGKNTAGVIFNLINNYKGWSNKTEIESNQNIKIDNPYKELSLEELKKLAGE